LILLANMPSPTSESHSKPDQSPKHSAWRLMAVGILLGLAAGLLVFFGFGPGKRWLARSGSQSLAPAVPQVDSPAPDFELSNLSGQDIRLSEQRGKAVLVNFWATWCGPCQAEMPLLQETQDRYADQLLILAVNNDEAPEKVQAFVDELDLSLAVLLDPGALVTQQYRVRGFPTTLVVDSQGILRYQHIGLLNPDTLSGYLEALGMRQ
jgi:thiol-disulfide isomerase/thioredoxin